MLKPGKAPLRCVTEKCCFFMLHSYLGVRKYHIGLEDERRLAMQRELAVLAIQNGMLGYQDRKVPVHVAPCRNSSESSISHRCASKLTMSRLGQTFAEKQQEASAEQIQAAIRARKVTNRHSSAVMRGSSAGSACETHSRRVSGRPV